MNSKRNEGVVSLEDESILNDPAGSVPKLPVGWELKKLREVCYKITDGTHQTPKYFDNGVIFLSSKNVTTGKIDWNDVKYIDEKQHIEMHKRVAPQIGDILLAKNGTTGVAAIVDRDEVFDIYVSLAHIRSLGEILPEYMLHFINSPVAKSQFNKRLKGVGVPNLHLQEIREVEITFPKSLAEQKRIVAILDKAFEAIDQARANIERNIENAKELFQSKLNEIFSQKGEGWEEKKLGELGTLTSSKRIFKKEYVTEGIPFYRSKEIKELAHNRDISLELFITEERYDEIKSKFGIPQAGDILLTAVGTIGEMYVVKENEKFYFKDGNIMWLKDFNTLNTYYLKYALTSYVEQLKAMSRGSAYSALTIEKLKEYYVPVPPKEEQVKIVGKLDALMNNINECISMYRSRCNILEELKKSILQKAFRGEL